MITFTLNIPDELGQEILNAYYAHYAEENEKRTKAQVFKQQMVGQIQNEVRIYRKHKKQAAEEAELNTDFASVT